MGEERFESGVVLIRDAVSLEFYHYNHGTDTASSSELPCAHAAIINHRRARNSIEKPRLPLNYCQICVDLCASFLVLLSCRHIPLWQIRLGDLVGLPRQSSRALTQPSLPWNAGCAVNWNHGVPRSLSWIRYLSTVTTLCDFLVPIASSSLLHALTAVPLSSQHNMSAVAPRLC